MSSFGALEATIALACVLASWMFYINRLRKTPPGPTHYPLVGNFWAYPKKAAWDPLFEYSKQYGDAVYFSNAFGNRILSLNSWEAIREMLEARSANTAERMQNHMIDVVGTQAELPFGIKSYDKDTALQRKLFVTALKKMTLNGGAEILDQESRRFAREIFARGNSDTFNADVRLLSARILLRYAYGMDPKSIHEEIVTRNDEVIQKLVKFGRPGFFLGNVIPGLQYLPEWVPGVKDILEAKNVGKLFDWIYNVPWKTVQQQRLQGTAGPSVSAFLQEGAAAPDHLLQVVSGAFYAAGIENIVITVKVVFKALLLYPEVQRKAQEELDRITDQNSLPGLPNRSEMPYIEAMVKEAMRWFSAVPLGLPHVTKEDDVWRGFFIPKGTLVLPNNWAVSRDPEMYPDPLNFKPERFMVPNPPLDPKRYVGGEGKRTCPGLDLSHLTTVAVVAAVLHTMNVKPPKDANGKEILPPIETKPVGTFHHLLPYDFVLEPRTASSLLQQLEIE